MSWDEVRKEAERLGLSLKNQSKKDGFEESFTEDSTNQMNRFTKNIKKEGTKKEEQLSQSVASFKLVTGGSTFYSDSDDYYQNAPRLEVFNEIGNMGERRKKVIEKVAAKKTKWVNDTYVDKKPPAFLKNILKLRNFFKRLDSKYSKKQCNCDEDEKCKKSAKECQKCRKLCKYCMEEPEDQLRSMHEHEALGVLDMAPRIVSRRGINKELLDDVAVVRDKKSQLGSVFSVRSVQSECSFCRTSHHSSAHHEHHCKYSPHDLSCVFPQQNKRHPPLFVKLPQQRLQQQIEKHQQLSQQHKDMSFQQKSSSLNRNLQKSNRFDSCLSFSSSSEQNSLEKHNSS